MEVRKMSTVINQQSVKVVKVKAIVHLSVVAFMLFTCLANAGKVQATVPVPSGFQVVSSGTGVTVYRKTYSSGAPDYVTVVDLRYATIQSYTGWAYSDGSVERRSLRTHWDNAVAQNTSSRRAKVAINGTFFATNAYPNAGIAFGLKANWWIMSTGYGLQEYPGKVLTLAYDSSFGSSSIQPHSVNTFNSGIPDVVGGLDNSVDKDGRRNSYIPRTYVGVRDDNNDTHSETIIFFSSAYATQDWAVQILGGFGAGTKMMLDGGGSTGLIVDGNDYIYTGRTLPQVFMISTGK